MVSRRNFLRGSFRSTAPPLRPPWALAEQLFIRACTRCGACAPVCPTSIISIQSGFPEVDFKRGECTFCGACAVACRHGALQDSELQLWPWAIKAQAGRDCLARRGVECRVCGDQCGVGAIRFSPRIGGPPEPEIDANACTGCGACVAPCPAAAIVIA
jgi:ferredoxin-type protein NapF